jgi:hypothetical protein
LEYYSIIEASFQIVPNHSIKKHEQEIPWFQGLHLEQRVGKRNQFLNC